MGRGSCADLKKAHKGAKLEDTLSFFHQLATLVSSGTPLVQALKIAAAQCESIKLRAVLDEITAKVAAGSTFHAAAASFPQIFEFQWLEAIRTGEVTGKMAQVLTELNKQIRESRETKRKVKGALMYPMILVIVAVIAVTVMLWLVVPVFAKMFKDMDAAIARQSPSSSSMRRTRSSSTAVYGVIAIMAIVVGFKQFMKTENGRRYVFGSTDGRAHRRPTRDRDGHVPLRLEPIAAPQKRRADDGNDAHDQGNLPDQSDLSRCARAQSLTRSRRAGPCTRH